MDLENSLAVGFTIFSLALKPSIQLPKKKVLSHVFQVTVNTPQKKANEYPLKIDFVGSDDSFPFRMVPLKKGRIRSFVVGVP